MGPSYYRRWALQTLYFVVSGFQQLVRLFLDFLRNCSVVPSTMIIASFEGCRDVDALIEAFGFAEDPSEKSPMQLEE